MTAMRMSAVGRAKLTQREGVRLKAYKDSVGIWTIGIGHTSAAGLPKVVPGLTITKAQCDEIFARDLQKYEDAVSMVVKVPVSQNEFDAMVSLCYNIGPGAFKSSTVVKKLNAHDRVGAAAAFANWNKAGGKILPGLVRRRADEAKQFQTPSVAAAKPAPVGSSAPARIPPDVPVSPPEAPAAKPSTAGGVAKTGGTLGGAAAAGAASHSAGLDPIYTALIVLAVLIVGAIVFVKFDR